MASVSNYVYVVKGAGAGNLNYEVGYWRTYEDGQIKFKAETRWTNKEAAAYRTSFMNGGQPVPTWMMEHLIDESVNYISPDAATQAMIDGQSDHNKSGTILEHRGERADGF
jgi:hypothetical protein